MEMFWIIDLMKIFLKLGSFLDGTASVQFRLTPL